MEKQTLTCPCCGYMTVDEDYDICPICWWQFDPYQHKNPDATGANQISLREAQVNFRTFGAKEERVLSEKRLQQSREDFNLDECWHQLPPNLK